MSNTMFIPDTHVDCTMYRTWPGPVCIIQNTTTGCDQAHVALTKPVSLYPSLWTVKYFLPTVSNIFSQLFQIFSYRQEDNWTSEWICWSKMVTQKWYQPINRMVLLLKQLHPIMLVFKDIFKQEIISTNKSRFRNKMNFVKF